MNDFLKNISNWGSHRPLLWLALENTKGNVIEIGMGQNSTPYLHEYCGNRNRHLHSIDNNSEYFSIGLETSFHSSAVVPDWDFLYSRYGLDKQKVSVILIDHAPAERRHVDAIRLKDQCEIMVIHDAEHEGLPYDVYEIAKITEHFKYRLDHSIPGMPAKTLLLSNTIDVSKFIIPHFTTL